MAEKVFVSYRREDAPGHAGRIFDHLVNHFGLGQVFHDIEAIGFGEDFLEAIRRAVGSCEVLIAIVGKQWSSIQDAKGRRRIDKPEDVVRLEIATALARNIRVIPVLVQGATMPSSDELPQDLAQLARLNAMELSDSRFHFDVERLIAAIESVRKQKRGREKPSPEEEPHPAEKLPPSPVETRPADRSPPVQQVFLRQPYSGTPSGKFQRQDLSQDVSEGSIILSSRWKDPQADAERLHQQLSTRFPGRVVTDLKASWPGVDLQYTLQLQVRSCRLLLVLIGPGWLEDRNAPGHRWLDDPKDPIRVELTTALKHKKRVIPVLVGGGSLPRPWELPEELGPLLQQPAVKLSSLDDPREIERLVSAIEQALSQGDPRARASTWALTGTLVLGLWLCVSALFLPSGSGLQILLGVITFGLSVFGLGGAHKARYGNAVVSLALALFSLPIYYLWNWNGIIVAVIIFTLSLAPDFLSGTHQRPWRYAKV